MGTSVSGEKWIRCLGSGDRGSFYAGRIGETDCGCLLEYDRDGNLRRQVHTVRKSFLLNKRI